MLTGNPQSGMAQALKLGSEFVAGVIVGFVIGYTIDKVFGSTPWGMIVFLLLGFAAGTLNVMRATGVVAERQPRRAGNPEATNRDGPAIGLGATAPAKVGGGDEGVWGPFPGSHTMKRAVFGAASAQEGAGRDLRQACEGLTGGCEPDRSDPSVHHQSAGGHPRRRLDLSFTNSSLYMIVTVAVIALVTLWGTSARAVVPGRAQSVAEVAYEFVANTLTSAAGHGSMRFFPLVFSLFMFVLVANLLGMVPYFFTVTSHIIVTFALAMIVFLTVSIYGFYKHGTHFFGIFAPSGVPAAIVPMVAVIEIISFLSRPLSLSVRLFANMLAGHITLKVFAGFVVTLSGLGFGGILGAILPLVMVVALTGLEFLVAFLQAYVFTILTCMYLNDALHPGH